jgi:hypothetical protein
LSVARASNVDVWHWNNGGNVEIWIWDIEKGVFWEKERENVPQTTALQTSDQDLDLRIFPKFTNCLGTIVETQLACQVDESPAFALADTAYNASKGTELNVDDDLDCCQRMQFFNVPTDLNVEFENFNI